MQYKPKLILPIIATAPLQASGRQSAPLESRNADVYLTCPYPRCKTGECDRIRSKQNQKQAEEEAMSKGTANEVLQDLVKKVTAVWNGKGERYTSADVYAACQKYIIEYEKGEQNNEQSDIDR